MDLVCGLHCHLACAFARNARQRRLPESRRCPPEDCDRGRIPVFHGPTPPEKREEIKQAFNTDPQKHPVRILVASDAAREGRNLQVYCYNLFHLLFPGAPAQRKELNAQPTQRRNSPVVQKEKALASPLAQTTSATKASPASSNSTNNATKKNSSTVRTNRR